MAQQAEASTLGMWVFLVTEIMFFGGLFMAYLVYRYQSPMGFQEASQHLNIDWGTANTAILIVSSLTMAFAVRAAQTSQKRETAGLLAGLRRWCLAPRSWASRRSSTPDKFTEHIIPGPHFQWARALPEARRAVLLAVLRDDGAARAAHGHRARHHDRDHDHGVEEDSSTASTTRRSKWPACTGTSSTSCGSSCSRCCI